MKHYKILVSTKDECWVAYTAEDLDEAAGYEQFCRAEMPGAKVRVERIEWEEER